MEGLTLKPVEYDERTLAEREQEAIDAAEVADTIEIENTEEVVAEETTEAVVENTDVVEDEPNLELDDERVLSHIRTKYNKDVSSIDELLKERLISEDLDPDVATFNKYKKETGRGIEDFVKLNRDLDKEDPIKLLSDFYKENGDDDDDVAYRLRKLNTDEFDSEDEAQEKTMALKQELKKAKTYFNEQKETYNIPLESRAKSLPDVDMEEFESLKADKITSASLREEQQKQSQYFVDKTNELFSDNFEGFKFKVDDNEIVYKPTDMTPAKAQMALQNLVESFLDDKGYVSDIEGFQRAMLVASDPVKFAKFFIEQGTSMAVSNFEKEGKNIDMVRSGNTTSTKSAGLQLKKVDSGNNSTFKIKKR